MDCEPVTRHDVVLAARRHLADGGSVVLFGPRGVGKSYVLRGLVDGARAHAGTVLWSEPGAAERPLPYATLADLLDPLADDALAALPPPQRSALRAVLRREEPAAGGPDPLGVRLGLLALLRGLTARGPVLLAVDGAQCVDDESAQTLAFAARRRGPGRVRAVVTETARAGAGPQTGAALCPGPALIRELPAPAAPELRELLDRHVAKKLPYWLVRRVHEACDGDLLDALEVVRALDRLPELPTRDQPLPLPEHIRADLAERLTGIPPAGRGLLLMAAAVRKGPVEWELLDAAARTAVVGGESGAWAGGGPAGRVGAGLRFLAGLGPGGREFPTNVHSIRVDGAANAVIEPCPGSAPPPPAPTPYVQPTAEPVTQPVTQAAPHAPTRPAAGPVTHPATQPTPQPTAQRVTQPTGHPVTQPTSSHPVTHPLTPALAAGLLALSDDGTAVRFVRPLDAVAVYATATAAERRTAHARLAAATLDPAEHARHLALAAPGPDAGVAEVLAGA
ncbi:AAA family ATPase, partial [Streptomyces sp. HSW2009]|uniref:AAA family ATPase n=1 Tax=Streptomyces sp. HSW2009 TaxID=3142890 RepID=UPI0032EA973C